jgi:serine protease Do
MTQTRKSFLLLAALAALAWTPSAFAQREDMRRDGPKLKAAFKSVVAAASDSTVRVQCDGKDAALGTVVGADGWIVTKYSELKDDRITCVFKDGRSFGAKLVGVHEPFDLAMLKVDAAGLKPVEWRDSHTAEVGDWVAAPGLGELPQAVGVVGVKSRKVSKRDLPNPPNPNGGYLGITLDEADGKGVKVVEVAKDSAAEKAELKKDDVIVAVNGRPTPDRDALLEQMLKYKVGDTIKVKINRGDKEMEVPVTLGKRPVGIDRADFQNRLGNELSARRGGFPAILQHDAFVKPVDCGGPLLDLDGKAVGINIARGGRVETFAVPAEEVQSLIADRENGRLPPPKTGPSEAEKRLTEAKAAYEKAVADKKAAEDKAKEAKAALDKAEADRKAAEAKAKAAKEALDKAEAEAKDKDKK